MEYKMRVGLWCARADNSGLGNQTYEFYRNYRPDKTAVIDISDVTGKPNHFDRYPGATIIKGIPTPSDINNFLRDLDLVFCCETPYNYKLFEIARFLGVKTVLQYNYEFYEYAQIPNLPKPDLFLSPSDWHFEELPENNKAVLPCPVNTAAIGRREMTQARTFVHIAGHELYEDRNGTLALLRAIERVQNPRVKFIIYSQHPIPDYKYNDPRIEYRKVDLDDYTELYNVGDVLILPRRYGGQSLQLNEAQAAGMLVIMPAVSPQDAFLPSELMFDTSGNKKIQTKTEIDCALIDPAVLASKIDAVANFDEKLIKELSEKSYQRALSISWIKLKGKYERLFSGLCAKG
jgi:hypothetical protein